MKLRIKMIGPLIYVTGFTEKEVDVPAGTTVDSLLEILGVPKERPKIVTRNGKAVAPQEVLDEGDAIAVSPIYSGG